ncbi:TraB/GumN family protein [Natronobeatus ordinarius]|uniref:TraB/GumN family protein n=1 Tax=Natronobeatus ordinarius TaxID=2963433 RepID=UPI0020CD08E6|nr:TraB/GumN family protein [Natronobeatus ordinarius]
MSADSRSGDDSEDGGPSAPGTDLEFVLESGPPLDPAAASAGEGSVTIVETTHGSAADVASLLETSERARPDVVAVEFDEFRYRRRADDAEDDEIDADELMSGKTGYQFLGHWLLSDVEDRHRDRFEVEPGADVAAATEAAARHDAAIALVDRNLEDTTQRLWNRLGLREKYSIVAALTADFGGPWRVGLFLGLFWGLLFGSILSLLWGPLVLPAILPPGVVPTGGLTGALFSTLDAVVAIVGIGLVLGTPLALALAVGTRAFDETAVVAGRLTDADPVTATLEAFTRASSDADALIDGRNAVIAHRLLTLREAGYDVVAVVGVGRRAAIEASLETPSELPPADSVLGAVETGRLRSRLYHAVGYVFMGAFVVLFVLVALGGSQDGVLVQLFVAWFLVNFVAAAGLAVLAGAHWTSAGVGGSIAWLTSVNPMITPGLFIGYVELRYTNVRLSDVWRMKTVLGDRTQSPLSRLTRAHASVGLFRILLIMTVANLGSFFASVLFVAVFLPYLAADVGGLGGLGDELVDATWEGVRILSGLLG